MTPRRWSPALPALAVALAVSASAPALAAQLAADDGARAERPERALVVQRATVLIDAPVADLGGRALGRIEDLLVDRDGHALAVLAGTDGTRVVPLELMTRRPDDDSIVPEQRAVFLLVEREQPPALPPRPEPRPDEGWLHAVRTAHGLAAERPADPDAPLVSLAARIGTSVGSGDDAGRAVVADVAFDPLTSRVGYAALRLPDDPEDRLRTVPWSVAGRPTAALAALDRKRMPLGEAFDANGTWPRRHEVAPRTPTSTTTR